ncbi:MAG: hypothetical protein MAG453_00968 [Calditrichaeota bacterium]|nr:hypothetical protein [Calditrichota bacterium]
MKITVIGSGNVGSSLAMHWVREGHSVTFGVRDPDSRKTRAALESAPGADAKPVTEACAGAEVVTLCTPYTAVEAVLKQAGELAGATVIDCTNPIGPGLTSLAAEGSSGAETIAALAPGAHVVKAFNSVGYEVMRDPIYGDRRAVMHYCGDDAGAKARARELIEACGFEPLDAGPLSVARHVENLALLWIELAVRQGLGRDFAYGLLVR